MLFIFWFFRRLFFVNQPCSANARRTHIQPVQMNEANERMKKKNPSPLIFIVYGFFFYQFLFYTHIVAIERMRFFKRNSSDLVWKFEYGFVDSNDDAGVIFFDHWLYNTATTTKIHIAKILLACDETAKMQTCTRDLNTEWKMCGFCLRRTFFFFCCCLFLFLLLVDCCVSLTEEEKKTAYDEILIHLHFRKKISYKQYLYSMMKYWQRFGVIMVVTRLALWVVCLGHLSHRLYTLRVHFDNDFLCFFFLSLFSKNRRTFSSADRLPKI